MSTGGVSRNNQPKSFAERVFGWPSTVVKGFGHRWVQQVRAAQNPPGGQQAAGGQQAVGGQPPAGGQPPGALALALALLPPPIPPPPPPPPQEGPQPTQDSISFLALLPHIIKFMFRSIFRIFLSATHLILYIVAVTELYFTRSYKDRTKGTHFDSYPILILISLVFYAFITCLLTGLVVLYIRTKTSAPRLWPVLLFLCRGIISGSLPTTALFLSLDISHGHGVECFIFATFSLTFLIKSLGFKDNLGIVEATSGTAIAIVGNGDAHKGIKFMYAFFSPVGRFIVLSFLDCLAEWCGENDVHVLTNIVDTNTGGGVEVNAAGAGGNAGEPAGANV